MLHSIYAIIANQIAEKARILPAHERKKSVIYRLEGPDRIKFSRTFLRPRQNIFLSGPT